MLPIAGPGHSTPSDENATPRSGVFFCGFLIRVGHPGRLPDQVADAAWHSCGKMPTL